MTRPDDANGGEYGERSDGERELRVFLERSVPNTPPPADRMRQIRERVVRRRRRRTAVVALSVAAAALCAVVLTPRGGDAPEAGRTAADPSSSLPSSNAPSSNAPTVDSSPPPTFVGDVLDLGLTVMVPGTWQLASGSDEQGRSAGWAYTLKPAPLVKESHTCSATAGNGTLCAPSFWLRDDSAVITFEQTGEHPVGNGSVSFVLTAVTAAGDSCRSMGGDREQTGWGSYPTKAKRAVVNAHVCFKNPSVRVVNQVRKILATATFAD